MFKHNDFEKIKNFVKAEDFKEESFWEKAKNAAKKAGKTVILQALELFYIAQDKETPIWARTIIYSALAYFVLPVDLIPDIVPVTGFTDDMAALVAAYKAVSVSSKPKHKALAEQKWQEWVD